jgi:hypothetical protein
MNVLLRIAALVLPGLGLPVLVLPALLLGPATASAQSSWAPVADAAKRAAPAHLHSLDRLPAGSVTQWRRAANKAGEWQVQLPDGSRLRIEQTQRIEHANGDISYSGSVAGADGRFGVLLTEGRSASFGRFSTPQGEFRFESFGAQGWMVDTGHALLREGPSGTPVRAPGFMAPVPEAKATATEPKNVAVVIDLLVLYSQGFADRYPGDATQTRINHLVAVSNQTLADSQVSLGIRLVGADLSAYPDSEGSNGTLLGAMRAALEGRSTAPSLVNLSNRRNQLGADLISFLRPHDAETRGSCGIANLFDGTDSRGVNVVSDGFSSWSLCGDEVLIHEIGHNLGAEHQNGANSANAGFGTALVLPGRFNTVMGSVGTGNPDRYRRLLRFSNPQQRCGGTACGINNVADNARRLRNNMEAVAAFAPERSAAPRPQALAARDPDADGDGVTDSDDAFPFDPAHNSDRDGDGVPDGLDAFPDNFVESADTDGDGLGDSRDPDIDGDGIANLQDAFPLDLSESSDRDNDRVGDNSDRFPDDRSEWSDLDGDGIGDNADLDRDGDGSDDLATGGSPAEHDLLVISAGTDRVLRLRGDSGRYAGIEIAEREQPQALGFQSALAWNPARKSVDALVATQLRRYERATAQRQTLAVGYQGGPQPALPSAFPAGLAVAPNGTVFIADEVSRSLVALDAASARIIEGQNAFAPGTSSFQEAPRALLRTPAGRLWALERSGTMIEFDASSGARLRTLPPPQIGVGLATALAYDASRDALLMADAARNRVLRVNLGSGLSEVLIASSAGGLSAPAGLAIGPDRRMYVSSAGSDQVLRYALDSGAFVDVFSQVPAGRLAEPRGLLFVPRVNDRYPDDASRQLRPMAAAWFDPQRAGHGFDLQMSGETLSLIWYTYTAAGEPTWYLAAGALQGRRMQAPWLSFRREGDASVPSAVGTVDIEFNGENAALLRWRLGDLSGEESIQPLWLDVTETMEFPTAAWYPPAASGWGLSLARGGDVHSGIAFIYTPDGRPTWVAGASAQPGPLLTMPMQRYTSLTRCPGCSGSAEPVPVAAGQLLFELLDGERARLDSDLRGADLEWLRSGEAFRRLTDSPTAVDGLPQH